MVPLTGRPLLTDPGVGGGDHLGPCPAAAERPTHPHQKHYPPEMKLEADFGYAQLSLGHSDLFVQQWSGVGTPQGLLRVRRRGAYLSVPSGGRGGPPRLPAVGCPV